MLFQFLPRLSDDEYAALEKSIIEYGIQVPIVVDENKSVIDGHHRKEIADRHGIDCPRRFAMDLDETQKRTLALSLNLDRRHLSREQKRELIQKSLKADPQLSNRQHADRTGVDHKTVKARRDDMQGRGEIPHVEQHTDSLGRQQPARADSAPAGVDPLTGETADDFDPQTTNDPESVTPDPEPFGWDQTFRSLQELSKFLTKNPSPQQRDSLARFAEQLLRKVTR